MTTSHATAQAGVTEQEVAALVQRTADANSALIRGDLTSYLGLITHAPDYTLMASFGGALPEQDWSLRVTQVYRRDGSQRQLVHRHADPLVKGIGLRQAAALARG